MAENSVLQRVNRKLCLKCVTVVVFGLKGREGDALGAPFRPIVMTVTRVENLFGQKWQVLHTWSTCLGQGW